MIQKTPLTKGHRVEIDTPVEIGLKNIQKETLEITAGEITALSPEIIPTGKVEINLKTDTQEKILETEIVRDTPLTKGMKDTPLKLDTPPPLEISLEIEITDPIALATLLETEIRDPTPQETGETEAEIRDLSLGIEAEIEIGETDLEIKDIPPNLETEITLEVEVEIALETDRAHETDTEKIPAENPRSPKEITVARDLLAPNIRT